jgi:hypothetical protein
MAPRIRLRILEGIYAVARLRPSDPIPSWADGNGLVSISRNDDELSIVCLRDRIPQGVQVDDGWSSLKFQGPFAFDETGIVLSVIEPLSKNDIGIFVVSTFDGDHLLVKASDLDRVVDLLVRAGHSFV